MEVEVVLKIRLILMDAENLMMFYNGLAKDL